MIVRALGAFALLCTFAAGATVEGHRDAPHPSPHFLPGRPAPHSAAVAPTDDAQSGEHSFAVAPHVTPLQKPAGTVKLHQQATSDAAEEEEEFLELHKDPSFPTTPKPEHRIPRGTMIAMGITSAIVSIGLVALVVWGIVELTKYLGTFT